MLKLEVLYADNSKEEFTDILKITLKKSTDTPADSLAVSLPFIIEKEICEVRLTGEEGLIFEGIADEQILGFSEAVTTEIIARSMEALLLDNEACPDFFKNPSSALVFSRYGKVCSLEDFKAPSGALKGTLKVYKGSSCYQVLKEFCERVYLETPFVSGRNLCIGRNKTEDELVFSEKAEGIVCTEIERTYRRCELISRVMVKTSSEGNYHKEISDRKSVASGIFRQRFADLSDLDAVSYSKAERMIENGRKRSVYFRVTATGRLTDVLGCSARVMAGDREYKNLVVTDVLYTFKDSKEETKITLSEKEE